MSYIPENHRTNCNLKLILLDRNWLTTKDSGKILSALPAMHSMNPHHARLVQVCMYACLYACIYAYMQSVKPQNFILICVHMYVCMYVYFVCMHTYTKHKPEGVGKHSYLHTYIHTYIHTYTQFNTPSRNRDRARNIHLYV